MELDDLFEQVKDRDSFFTFVRALIVDREASVEQEKSTPSSSYEPDACGWQNVTIEDFLESALAWAEDTNFPEQPSWKDFALFLYCGKTYE